MQDAIASTGLEGIEATGQRFAVELHVGKPEPSSALSNVWVCAISAPPLFPARHVTGTDAFHALCLAIEALFLLLADFVRAGGRLLHANGDLFDPATYRIGTRFDWT
jgi:hypothetical protein